MKLLFERPMFAVGLLLFALTACQSDPLTGPDMDATSAPQALLGLPWLGDASQEPTLIRVRQGRTLTPDDATLSFLKNALSFPTGITKEVDGDGYVAFRFGPSGLTFQPAAVLAISIDKADLHGIDPRRLKIAVASDDRDDWEVVGGIYIPLARIVVAPVLHFSRYALCVD